MVVIRRPLRLLALGFFSVSAFLVGGQEAASSNEALLEEATAAVAPEDTVVPVELAPRFAIAVIADDTDPALRLVTDAVRTSIDENVDALFFDLSGQVSTPDQTPEDSLEVIAQRGWSEFQAEIVIVLTVSRQEGEEIEVNAQYLRVPVGSSEMELLGSSRVTVRIDNAGRYQRPRNYESIVAAVENLRGAALPGREVLIRSNGPFSVDGLPPYVPATTTDGTEIAVTLRGLSAYEITLNREGYRSASERFYLERKPLSVDVPLKPYPRHTVAATFRNVSFPGIEYAYLPASTRWMAHAGFTSFLFGLTPLRQMAHESDDPQLITSYGLTELEAGWQWLFRDRDRPHRFGAGAAATLRLVHGNADFGVDPIIPGALRLIGSWEWELPGRFVLSQRLSTDWFASFNPEFLKPFPWMYRVGPVYWQLPIYRIGVRVRI